MENILTVVEEIKEVLDDSKAFDYDFSLDTDESRTIWAKAARPRGTRMTHFLEAIEKINPSFLGGGKDWLVREETVVLKDGVYYFKSVQSFNW